jgi:hypothetical protein
LVEEDREAEALAAIFKGLASRYNQPAVNRLEKSLLVM